MKTETVTVLRQATNRYGDRETVSSHDVADCLLVPQQGAATDERHQHSDETTDRLVLYGPAGMDITTTDRVQRADGAVYDVFGTPNFYSDVFGGAPDLSGTVVHLERMAG